MVKKIILISGFLTALFGFFTLGENSAFAAAPVISSVIDAPDSISVGSAETFNVYWFDADGNTSRAFICKTNAFTTSCSGGQWCAYSAYNTTSPQSCSYTAAAGDVGTKNYYAFVRDSTGAVSASVAGAFTVFANVAPTISSVIDFPDPVGIGSPIAFYVNWSDPTDQTKIKICKTNSLTGVNCSGGYWCQTAVFSDSSPTSCSYTPTAAATNNYYAFACDDYNICSASTAGTFIAQVTAPDITTDNATAVKSATASLGGTITNLHGANVTKYGFEWGTSPGVYTDSWESGAVNYSAVPQSITRAITGLTPGIIYYFRAKAFNSAGWGYGTEQSFTTFNFSLVPNPASGSVAPGNSVQTTITATLSGTTLYSVNFSVPFAIGGVSYTFNPTSCNATCDTVLTIQTSASTPVADYSIPIRGISVTGGNLTREATYALSVGYVAPIVSTAAATGITKNSARLNGNITAIGGQNADQRGFEWGTTTGTYYRNFISSGSFGTGVFNYNIPAGQLSPGTTYYYRAKAHNSKGWGYGEEVIFMTRATVTVTIAGTAFGTVTSAPAGINCGINRDTICSMLLSGGEMITLTAAPVANFIFAGWSGACSGTGSCNLIIDGDKSVTATFNTKGYSIILRPNSNGDLNQFEIAVPSGQHWETVDDVIRDDSSTYVHTITRDCPTCGEKAELFRYPVPSGSGIINSVSVVYVIYGNGGPAYFFTELKTNGERYVVGTGQPSASYWQTYASTFTSNPVAGGSWTWPQLNSIQAGAGGYLKGDGAISITQVYLLIDYGTLTNYTLTIDNPGPGVGTVTSTPIGINCGAACSALYASGTAVTLNATAGSSSNFDGWSGAGCSGAGPCTLVMDANKTVTANFSATVPCASHNVSGYAWSENIGWISTNCVNTIALGTGRDFGLDISSITGVFSGYAWSENIGWINFAPAGPYPTAPNYSAKVDLATGQVSGWARVLANGGGWDGWLKLRGSNYGASITGNPGVFSGYAWSDAVLGWTKFSGSNYGVRTNIGFGPPPPPPNSPPSKPFIPSPGETWNRCSFKGKAVPTFTWTYSDPDGDPQASYEVEVDDNASFNAPKFNHLVNSPSTSYVLDLSQDDTPDWISELLWSNNYFWRVRVKDSQGNWSQWSNSNQFRTDKHAYPYVSYNFTPAEPTKGETVEFNSSATQSFDSILSYLWTIVSGAGVFVDGTNSASPAPHIQFSTLNNTVRLQVTDTDNYSCSLDKDIAVTLPLPEYKEVPPIIWLKKMLASLILF